MEKERDFYFGKLREIELLCQEHGQENDDLVQRLMEVLYASDEHEGHPEEPEAEEQVHEQQPQQQEEYWTVLAALDTSILCGNFSSGELEHVWPQAQQKPVVPSLPVTSPRCRICQPLHSVPISFAKTH